MISHWGEIFLNTLYILPNHACNLRYKHKSYQSCISCFGAYQISSLTSKTNDILKRLVTLPEAYNVIITIKMYKNWHSVILGQEGYIVDFAQVQLQMTP